MKQSVNRFYYSDFTRENPLPDEVLFLKKIRPKFFAINYTKNKETGKNEIGVEYSVRNTKAICDLINNYNEEKFDKKIIDGAFKKMHDIVQAIGKDEIIIAAKYSSIGRGSLNKFIEKSDNNVLKGIDILSKAVSDLLRIRQELVNDNYSLWEKNEKLCKKINDLGSAPIKHKSENKNLSEKIKDANALRHEDQIKMGNLKNQIKSLESDIELIKSERTREVNSLRDEIDRLKNNQV